MLCWSRFGGIRTSASKAKRRHRDWKDLAAWGIVVLVLSIIINSSLLVWCSRQPPPPGAPSNPAYHVLFFGDCDQANKIQLWLDIAVNVVSTLILATGTTCMQYLSAPTRREVERAHTSGAWLDIGVFSLRNLLSIDPKRSVIIVVLMLSSLPMHLLFNSVFFAVTPSNDTLTLIVTERFFSPGPIDASELKKLVDIDREIWRNLYEKALQQINHERNQLVNIEAHPAEPQILRSIETLRNSSSGETRTLDAFDCFSELRQPPITLGVRNVAVVASGIPDTSMILNAMSTQAPYTPNFFGCNRPGGIFNSTRSIMDAKSCPQSAPFFSLQTHEQFDQPWKVDRCIVHEANGNQNCALAFAPALMGTVIVASVVKFCALVYAVLCLQFTPLLTIGDAISSFITKPEATTRGLGPVSNASILKASRRQKCSTGTLGAVRKFASACVQFRGDPGCTCTNVWKSTNYRWGSSVSFLRWFALAAIPLGELGYGIYSFSQIILINEGITFSDIFSKEFNEIQMQLPGGWYWGSGAQSIMSNSVGVNLWQILITIASFVYNNALTSMLTASESANFAARAKSLRVSSRLKGQERGTHFLQLPLRYAIPNIVIFTTLHWLLSRAAYMVRFSGYDIEGRLYVSTVTTGIGSQTSALFFACIVGIVILAAPALLAMRRLPAGIPIVGHNSLAISAACHTGPHEPPGAASRPLKYGRMIPTEGEVATGSEIEKAATRPLRVGFSSGVVQRLQDGDEIEVTKCLCSVLLKRPRRGDGCCLERASRRADSPGDEESLLATGKSDCRATAGMTHVCLNDQ